MRQARRLPPPTRHGQLLELDDPELLTEEAVSAAAAKVPPAFPYGRRSAVSRIVCDYLGAVDVAELARRAGTSVEDAARLLDTIKPRRR